MISVFLCDDNEILLSHYRSKLSAIAESHGEEICFSCFSSGESLLFYLAENPNEPDIIFLDILMGKLNGIDTANKLRDAGSISEIIFLTSSEEFVYDSFNAAPLYYILKGSPEEDAKLIDVFLKAISIVKAKSTDIFLFESAGQKKKLPLHKISHFEVQRRVVTVHLREETLNFYSSLDAIAESLQDKKFVRCHKSFLINLKYIDTIQKNTIHLTNGTLIPLGSIYARDVKLAFSKTLSTFFS